MALDKRDHDQRMMTPAAHVIQNQPAPMMELATPGDELLGDADEPPDDQHTPRPGSAFLAQHEATLEPKFHRKILPPTRKQSLLTALIQVSEGSDSASTDDDDNHDDLRRAMADSVVSPRGLSSASISTTSTAELTSDGGLTSPTRTASPSPPLPPARFTGIAPVFKSPFAQIQPSPAALKMPEAIDPLQRAANVDDPERQIEAGLGRKRCITFACGGRKDLPKPAASPRQPSPAPAVQPAKRPCALRFACPTKISFNALDKKRAPRMVSPAPAFVTKRTASPRPSPRHRGSDSTVRNESPKEVRKVPSISMNRRKWSESSDLSKREATRFHEFAGSAEDVDEWTEEKTCYRTRMTVNDTLKAEMELKRLAEEAEEEALQEDEDEEDEEEEEDEDEDEDEDLDEDLLGEDDDGAETLSQAATQIPEDEESDDGFHSDNEDGFASSSDESDANSEYHFWIPGRSSTAATSTENVGHVRPSSRQSNSDSSISSHHRTSPPRPSSEARKIRRQRRNRPGAATHDLPDSTDFVCGTLDEDRPLEQAYLINLEKRRAAMHIPRPQDIDPSFPASDPEMDEEDEVDDNEKDEDVSMHDESDHQFMHGPMDPHEEPERRGRRNAGAKRSPQLSPRRLRSPPPPTKRMRSPPPPVKRTVQACRSPPPPRKLFGQSPRRQRSPLQPQIRYRSPPPTRRPSFQKAGKQPANIPFTSGLGLGLAFATSLPRRPSMMRMERMSTFDEEESDEAPCRTGARDIRVRGAIDIVKGLEKKRERRRQKLYEKQCRKFALGKEKPIKRFQPGKGAEKMREVGLEIQAYRGRARPLPMDNPDRLLMLSC